MPITATVVIDNSQVLIGAKARTGHRTEEHTERVNNVERSKWNAGNASGGVLGCRVCAGVPVTAHVRNAAAGSASSGGELDARFVSDVIPLREPLYRHALRMTRNRPDAEDLLQDTMLKAYAGLHSFKQDTNLRGWLYRIMTNAYINGYRKKQRQSAHYTAGLITDALLATAAHHSSMGPRSPEEEILNRLGDNEIREAMCALPDQFRVAVYYADVEGFSTKEVADLMQSPVGTVTSRLHRGRRLLRQLLGDVGEQRENTTVDDAA
jgi:RNA polymerase sigma-70 factor, ECF subfamily